MSVCGRSSGRGHQESLTASQRARLLLELGQPCSGITATRLYVYRHCGAKSLKRKDSQNSTEARTQAGLIPPHRLLLSCSTAIDLALSTILLKGIVSCCCEPRSFPALSRGESPVRTLQANKQFHRQPAGLTARLAMARKFTSRVQSVAVNPVVLLVAPQKNDGSSAAKSRWLRSCPAPELLQR